MEVIRAAGGVLLLALAGATAPAPRALANEERVIKRVIVALYDSKEERVAIRTRIHNVATMPLNHLGLIVRLHDIRKGLPPKALMSQARGVLTWFSGPSVGNPQAYLKWANMQAAAGMRFVILGNPGVQRARLTTPLTQKLYDLFLARLGVRWSNRWVSLTYDTKIVRTDPALFGLERKLPPILPPYPTVTASGDGVAAHLTVEDKRTQRRSDLVITGPNGGFVAGAYAVHLTQRRGVQQRAWLVNPFAFFRRAFGTDDLPKPDTTTVSGRRLFYSHVDGDAWHNITRIEQFRGTRTVSAAVHYQWIIRGYPDLPVTIGPVTGDILSSWYGNAAAQALARKMFAAPNVEIGSHTHSHPFAWGFFRRYRPKDEVPFLGRYPRRPGKSQGDSVWRPNAKDETASKKGKASRVSLSRHYSRPRAYAVKRFDLKTEIAGSIKQLQVLAPAGKKVAILQWSGDTNPFAAAIGLTRKLGVRNINGGDPRMDGRHRSYAWVSGIGRRVGDTWQIYSSGANENIYTAGWTRNFSAYRQVVDTFRNTETPIRIKPINIYYHFYIMERSDSARALRLALEFARSQQIAPITTSRYAAIADGFFSARIVSLGKNRWRFENRDGLDTIRFDKATLKAVDFKRSSGVIGQRHFQGSLYVALDVGDRRPVIALKKAAETDREAPADRPYLVQARWRVFGLRFAGGQFQYDTQGFGTGAFEWFAPKAGRYRIRAITIGGKPVTQEFIVATNGSRLNFRIKTNDARLRRVHVTFLGPPR